MTEKKKMMERINAIRKDIIDNPPEKEGIYSTGLPGGRGTYSYFTYEQILKLLNPLLVKHGLVIAFGELESKELPAIGSMHTHFTLKGFAFVSTTDTDEQPREFPILGEAGDSGDKALAKAKTSARKGFLCGLFGITDEYDPDNTPADLVVDLTTGSIPKRNETAKNVLNEYKAPMQAPPSTDPAMRSAPAPPTNAPTAIQTPTAPPVAEKPKRTRGPNKPKEPIAVAGAPVQAPEQPKAPVAPAEQPKPAVEPAKATAEVKPTTPPKAQAPPAPAPAEEKKKWTPGPMEQDKPPVQAPPATKPPTTQAKPPTQAKTEVNPIMGQPMPPADAIAPHCATDAQRRMVTQIHNQLASEGMLSTDEYARELADYPDAQKDKAKASAYIQFWSLKLQG